MKCPPSVTNGSPFAALLRRRSPWHPARSAAAATARRVQFEDEELQLKEDNILAPPVQSNPVAPPAAEDADQWASGDQPRTARTGREGGTLFERMSSIARGAKGHAEAPPPAAGRERSDPLDIPRFLNKQNNQ